MTRYHTLRSQHSSLQFSDSSKQQLHDIQKIFEEGKRFPIKTGTEAGPDASSQNMNRAHLRNVARKHKHTIRFARDNWIAVDNSIIVPKTFKAGQVFVADNSETVGRGHDSVFCTVQFQHTTPGVGTIAQAACHYPTKGRTKRDPNWRINQRYANEIQKWILTAGAGPRLAFVNGDFNMLDNKSDWAFGNDWTSIADELKAWQNTGHGPIDGMASYDRDRRVKAKAFNVLDDKEFFLHTDHFLARAAWQIRLLNV